MRAAPSGRLNKYVTIEQLSGGTGLDSYGQPTTEWVALQRSVPVSIRKVSGNEGILTRQLFPTATHKIEMRYRRDMTPKLRINYDGRIFNIFDIDDVGEMNVNLVLTVGEEV